MDNWCDLNYAIVMREFSSMFLFNLKTYLGPWFGMSLQLSTNMRDTNLVPALFHLSLTLPKCPASLLWEYGWLPYLVLLFFGDLPGNVFYGSLLISGTPSHCSWNSHSYWLKVVGGEWLGNVQISNWALSCRNLHSQFRTWWVIKTIECMNFKSNYTIVM